MRNPGQQYCQDANGRLQMVGIRLAAANGSANGSGNSSGCVNNGDPLNLSFSYGSAGSNNGNLISETLLPLNNTQTFTYDAYNRLSTAKEGSTNWSQTYKYDVNGNANTSLGNRYVSATSGLSLLPSSFTPTTNTNFNSSNQLIIQGSTYDKAGNLKTMGAYRFTYDAENRQVTNTVSGSNTYSYDGEGRRIQKVTASPAATTVYVYDAKGEVAAEYASAPSGQLETTYLTTDHLGSTRLATTADGTVLGYHDYLPFGEEIPATIGGRSGLYGSAGDAVTHKFTGKERDAETASSATQGDDYFGARYYSSSQGRFRRQAVTRSIPSTTASSLDNRIAGPDLVSGTAQTVQSLACCHCGSTLAFVRRNRQILEAGIGHPAASIPCNPYRAREPAVPAKPARVSSSSSTIPVLIISGATQPV